MERQNSLTATVRTLNDIRAELHAVRQDIYRIEDLMINRFCDGSNIYNTKYVKELDKHRENEHRLIKEAKEIKQEPIRIPTSLSEHRGRIIDILV